MLMKTEIHMPSLSPGMTEGKLVRWLKKEGDWVKRGDVIAELETDKSLLEFESIATGRLEKILIAESEDDIAVDTPLAILVTEGEDEPVAATPAPEPIAASASPAVAKAAPAPLASRPERIAASPRAKRMAAEAGFNLADISGSGPDGRIIEADIERTLGSRNGATGTSVANSSARRIIAARLTEAASTIPHFYLTIDCRMDALLALRSQMNAEASGHKLSVNDFIIRACALALQKVPAVNASWGEEAIRLHRDIDVAVAVAAPDGLVTPIVRKADTKSVATIGAEMKQLAERARERKLRPEEFQGGGFAISNLGMHGIRQFTAIINPPHVAILAVGAAEPRAVVQSGDIVVATMMTCTLSCDHRAIDGAKGAEFLECFRELIEQPREPG
jgi:pyruvate dehydrogenase E2 component (dihydrolipoamide acetyltransferase)